MKPLNVEFKWIYTVNGIPCELCISGDIGFVYYSGDTGHLIMGKRIQHDKKKFYYAVPKEKK